MTEDLFAHAWARLDRASELAGEMVELWNDYIAGHPYSFDLISEGQGVYVLRVNEDAPPPQEFAVATGEWINHLRSALDYTLWAAAAHQSGTIPPPQQGQIQYPIYDSQAAWDRNLYRLKSLADHHRHMLRTMQPFNSDPDANYLGWVNRIARSHRHRHLSRMTGYLAELNPALRVPEGTTVTRQWGERVIADGHADVARFVVRPWHEGLSVEVNPRAGIDPEIEEWSASKFWRQHPFSTRLRILQVFVGAEIAIYEYDCTGHSRKKEALTESYVAECDARRTEAVRHPRRTPRTVAWTEPEPARHPTPSEFDGDDFPPTGPGTSRDWTARSED